MAARDMALYAVAGAIAITGCVISTGKVKTYTNRPYLHTNLYLPSGKFVEQVSMNYQQMAADMVWFQAIQYYGGFRKGDHDLAYFAGLIDIVTDLDPHFIFPYRFGAVILSQDLGAFPHAVKLLRKGMEHNPTSWELPFELGFLSYIDAHNNVMAARYFELAAKMPGGGDRARRFAAYVYASGGHTSNSLRMWEELMEETDEPYMREMAERYINRLRAQLEAEPRRES